MSEILVNCHCGQQLTVPSNQGTTEFQCPRCGQLLTVATPVSQGRYSPAQPSVATPNQPVPQNADHHLHNNPLDSTETFQTSAGPSKFPWFTLTICGLSVGLVMVIIAIAASLAPNDNRQAQNPKTEPVNQKEEKPKPERNKPADDEGFGRIDKEEKNDVNNRRNPFDGGRNQGGKLDPDELDPRKLLDEKLAEAKKKRDEVFNKIKDRKENQKPAANDQKKKDDRDGKDRNDVNDNEIDREKKGNEDEEKKKAPKAGDREDSRIGQILDEMLGELAGVDLKKEIEVDMNKLVPASKNSLRIGLHLYPPGLIYLAYLDFEKVKQNPKPENFSYYGLTEAFKELKKSIGVEEKDLSFVTLGRIGSHRNYFGFGLFHRPILMVLKLKSSFDVSGISESEFEKQTISGQTIYSPSTGFSLGLLNDQTLLIGTRNEVLYALKNRNKKTTDPGYDWIDFSKYEGVFFLHDPRQWGNAINKDTIYTFIKQRDSLVAKAVVDHAQEFWGALRSDNPRQSRLFREADPKVIETLQKQMEAIEIDAWPDGNIVVQAVKGIKEPYTYHTKSWKTFADIFGSFVRRTGNYGSGKKELVDETVAMSKRFDTYQFQNFEKRDSLLRQLSSNVRRITNYSTTVNYSSDLYSLLASTSSAKIRNTCLDGFSDCFDENAMIVLGRESESFALLKTEEPIGFEERSSSSRSRSPSLSIKSIGKLRLTALYYVRCGMDPKVVYSAIRILEDIGTEKHVAALEKVKQKDFFPEYVSKAADRAIAVLQGQKPKTKNIPTAPDAETALAWMGDPLRKNRLAALQWALENPLPDDNRTEMMDKLIFLLDDSILREKAIEVFKKRGNESDFPALRKIIETASGPNANNFRIRHNYSLEVVMELLKHFKDSEGLLMAFSRFEDYRTADWIADMIADVGVDLDPFVQQAIENYFAGVNAADNSNRKRVSISTWCSKMRHLKLNESQQDMLRKWFVKSVEQGHMNHNMIRLMKDYGIFKKKYVPLLIKIWAQESVSDSDLIKYLVKYGTSIEPMVLEEIKQVDHVFNFHVRRAADLLKQIGTEESVAYLSEYADDERLGERAIEAIDEIQKANRTSQEFASVNVD